MDQSPHSYEEGEISESSRQRVPPPPADNSDTLHSNGGHSGSSWKSSHHHHHHLPNLHRGGLKDEFDRRSSTSSGHFRDESSGRNMDRGDWGKFYQSEHAFDQMPRPEKNYYDYDHREYGYPGDSSRLSGKPAVRGEHADYRGRYPTPPHLYRSSSKPADGDDYVDMERRGAILSQHELVSAKPGHHYPPSRERLPSDVDSRQFSVASRRQDYCRTESRDEPVAAAAPAAVVAPPFDSRQQKRALSIAESELPSRKLSKVDSEAQQEGGEVTEQTPVETRAPSNIPSSAPTSEDQSTAGGRSRSTLLTRGVEDSSKLNASSVLGTDDTSTSVRFTLPVATKLVENASSTGHRFLYSVESTIPPKSVGGMVPVATPQKEESSRKPRAAWGQGLVRATKVEEPAARPMSEKDAAMQANTELAPTSAQSTMSDSAAIATTENLPIAEEAAEVEAEEEAVAGAEMDTEVEAEAETEVEAEVEIEPETEADVETKAEMPADEDVKVEVEEPVDVDVEEKILESTDNSSPSHEDSKDVTASVPSEVTTQLDASSESESEPTEQAPVQQEVSGDISATEVVDKSPASLPKPETPTSSSIIGRDAAGQQSKVRSAVPSGGFRGSTGRGFGRGRGRMSNRETKSVPSGASRANQDSDAAHRPSVKEHKSRSKESMRFLGSIFSKEADIHRAYNAIVYMLELQKSNSDTWQPANFHRITQLSNLLQDIKTVQAAAQLVIPRPNETSFALDLLNHTADNYYLVLKNYREKQYMLELKLKDLLKVSDKAKPSAIAPKHSVAGDNPAHNSTLADIQHHNKLRVLEAHFFHTIVQCSPPPTASDDVHTSHALEGSPPSLGDYLKGRGLPSVSSATELCLSEASQSLQTAFPVPPSVESAMKAKRASIAEVIRNRKLGRRTGWEQLGDGYLNVLHKWKAHVTDIEKVENELAQAEGPVLRGAPPSTHSMRAIGFGSDGGGRRASMGSAGESSALSSAYKPPSTQASSSSYPSSSMIVRSDYDQERLINEILWKEMRQARIESGLVEAPTMRSPWPYADTSRKPSIPQWPSDIREITVRPSASQRPTPNAVFPSYQHDWNDFIDCVGRRLTTDGKRQLCSSVDSSIPCPLNCNCAFQLEKLNNVERIWTDIEKCVFVDKFVQFPKNFHRIASFLPNRTSKDCVKFYYDAKSTVEFKQLLKEYDNRRRQAKANWHYSLKAAHYTGGAIFPAADGESKDFLVQPPMDDGSFLTFANQPPHCTKLFGIPIPMYYHKISLENEEGKRQVTQIYPTASVIRSSIRRRLDNYIVSAIQADQQSMLGKARKRRSDSDDEMENESYEEILFASGLAENDHGQTESGLSFEPFGSGFLYSYNPKRLSELLPLYTFRSINAKASARRTFYSDLAGEGHLGAAVPPLNGGFHDDVSAMDDGTAPQFTMLASSGSFASGSSNDPGLFAGRAIAGRRPGRGRGRAAQLQSNPPIGPPRSPPLADQRPMVTGGRGFGRGRGRSAGPGREDGTSGTLPSGGRGRGRGRGRNSTTLLLLSAGRGRGGRGPLPKAAEPKEPSEGRESESPPLESEADRAEPADAKNTMEEQTTMTVENEEEASEVVPANSST